MRICNECLCDLGGPHDASCSQHPKNRLAELGDKVEKGKLPKREHAAPVAPTPRYWNYEALPCAKCEVSIDGQCLNLPSAEQLEIIGEQVHQWV